VYRIAQVRREPRLPGETTVRVIVSIEEADRTPWGFGVGVEGATRPRAVVGGGVEDQLEFAPRAFVEFGLRGIGGKNRAVSLYSRVALKPKNAPGDPLQDGKGLGFPEYRVTATYIERFAFGLNSDILATAISEQAIRTSFNFIRRIGSFSFLRPVTERVSAQARYSLEWTKLFDTAIPEDEQPLVDRLFPQVRLSIISGGILWDRRDRPLNTRTGEQFDANIDLALKPLGSEVSFVKFFAQASFFRPVGSTPITFASRLQMGLSRGLETLVPILPASHRFFAGGSTSVRGFQLDRLGVEEILNENGLSNGGNAMFVLNVEMRAIVGQLFRRNVTFVWFVDTGNVFQRTGDLDLGRLRTAVGVGARYDSWIGPIRVDFGFKTDRMIFAKANERRWEIHLSIGEVF
jgi:outer membrane protein assembly factor BamA